MRAPPAREDAFARLAFSDPRAEEPLGGSIRNQGLVLALVISENSRKAVDYLNDIKLMAAESGRASRMEADLDAAPLIAGMTELLNQYFSRTVQVDSPSEAVEVRADLIGVVDLYVELGKVSFSTTTVDLSVILTTLDGRPIETINGIGKAKVPIPATHFAFRKASRGAIESFANSLQRLP